MVCLTNFPLGENYLTPLSLQTSTGPVINPVATPAAAGLEVSWTNFPLGKN